GWLSNRQIEAARIAMTRKIKRGGKVWINVFPDKPVTKKPAETRMGKGKGSPEGWVAVVKPGRIMFELARLPEPLAKEALRLAGGGDGSRCRWGRRRRGFGSSDRHRAGRRAARAGACDRAGGDSGRRARGDDRARAGAGRRCGDGRAGSRSRGSC